MTFDGFQLLQAGLLIFATFHLASSTYELRRKFIAILGLTGFRATHSIFSTLGLVLIVMGFGDAPFDPVYDPPPWGHWVPLLVMPVALAFLLGAANGPLDLSRYQRHPLLFGIFLFGIAHLFANGDRASLYLFGTFALYALLAMGFADRKQRLTDPDLFAAVRAQTSLIPFVAVIKGRALPAPPGRDLKAVLYALLIYGLIVFAHPFFTGVSVLPAG